MDYHIAIPSYHRPREVMRKTLTTLARADLLSRATIFVADELELAEYRLTCHDLPIVVGKLGLVAQRQFISSYYPAGSLIVFLDDDITGFKTLADGKLQKTDQLDAFFRQAFATMTEAGARIWGLYAASNKMFMERQPAISYGLSYLIGACYGIVNSDVPVLELGDNQEDKERTIRYWEADGKLVRFNHWTILTRYYAPGGMDTPTRKAETKAGTDALVARWPQFFTQIQKPKSGIYDVRFRTAAVAKSATRDPLDARLDYLPVSDGYEAAKSHLLTILRRTTIPPLGKPTAPERRKRHGKRADNIGSIGRSLTFGYGNTRMRGFSEFAPNKKYPQLLKALIEFGNTVAPVGWRYTTITLNHGVQARRHKDTSNVGRSIIIGIGDYTGGALRVWEEDDSSYQDLELRDRPAMFNGATRAHETQPFEGERYTIIYYHGPRAGACAGMPAMEGTAPLASADMIQLV